MNEEQVGMAGALATTAVPKAEATETVKEVLQRVQAFSGEFDTIDYIYILQAAKLIGVISLHELYGENPRNPFSGLHAYSYRTCTCQL